MATVIPITTPTHQPKPPSVQQARMAQLAERRAIGAFTSEIVCPFCHLVIEGVAFSEGQAAGKANTAFAAHYMAEHRARGQV